MLSMVATSGWVWPEDFSRSSKACGDTTRSFHLAVRSVWVSGRYDPGSPSHLFAERYRDLVPPLGRVLDDQVVERPKAGGDLVAALLGGGGGAAVVRLRH